MKTNPASTRGGPTGGGAPALGPLRLYLIRHGETEWSISGRHSGRADIALTAQGEEEARVAGSRLRHLSFSQVLTSPLRRARQTCALAALGPSPRIVADLAEWDNGDDEGRTAAEILASRPGWNVFRDGSPGGESPAQISARADRLVEHLRTLEGAIALFSHGHFGRVLAARWIGLSVEQSEAFLLGTGSVSILGYAHEGTGRPSIELWNSVAPEFPAPPSELGGGAGRVLNQRAVERRENGGGERGEVG